MTLNPTDKNPIEAASRLTVWEAFLPAHARLTHVDGVLVDLCGIVRGQRYRREEAPKLFEQGYRLPYNTVFLDVTGVCADPRGPAPRCATIVGSRRACAR
ncbi:MAG: hypothetical protein ACR2RL_24175 [Gammaproteobacteria bacterium]